MEKKTVKKIYMTGTPEEDFANEKAGPSCYLCHRKQGEKIITLNSFNKMEHLPPIDFITLTYTLDEKEKIVFFLCWYCFLLVEAILKYGEKKKVNEQKPLLSKMQTV
ncbi:MAG: hypothetical protein V2A65_02930 [Candidatus Omnitrophota bacterium]